MTLKPLGYDRYVWNIFGTFFQDGTFYNIGFAFIKRAANLGDFDGAAPQSEPQRLKLTLGHA